MDWSAGEVDPDTAIVAADPLCQQALDCQAEDMAIEDTLYALERALTDGHLPADTYLKQVCPPLHPLPYCSCLHTCLFIACVSGIHSQPPPLVLTHSKYTMDLSKRSNAHTPPCQHKQGIPIQIHQDNRESAKCAA